MSDDNTSIDLVSAPTLSTVLSPKSAWNAARAAAFLRSTLIPLRVSTLDADGFPHITSLWFQYSSDHFFCCTQQSALICHHLKRNPKVGFEVASNSPPYHGVSGHGLGAIVAQDPIPILESLIDHYLQGRDRKLERWLLSRITTEVVIAITPRRITSWDFSRRMTNTS